jgi:hypothetical protein
MTWAARPPGIRWLAGGIAAAVLALTIAWVLFVPAADWLGHHDAGSAKGPLVQTARDAAGGAEAGIGLFAGAVPGTRGRASPAHSEAGDRNRPEKSLGRELAELVNAQLRPLPEAARDHDALIAEYRRAAAVRLQVPGCAGFVSQQARQLSCRTVRAEQFRWGQDVQFCPVGYLLGDEPEVIVIDIRTDWPVFLANRPNAGTGHALRSHVGAQPSKGHFGASPSSLWTRQASAACSSRSWPRVGSAVPIGAKK